MSYIETHGNTNLLAITESEKNDLWNKITGNGEAWDRYGDSMGNNNAAVLAAEHRGIVYPLYEDGYGNNDSENYFLPIFKVHAGHKKLGLEAEEKDGYIYLLQEFEWSSSDPKGTTQVVEKFKLSVQTLDTKNGITKEGIVADGWESSSQALEDKGQEHLWEKFKSDYSFFEKFGGKSAITSENEEQTTSEEDNFNTITAPTKFKVKNIDKITNFNPSTDTLEIDTNSFGIGSSATFAAGASKKEVKKVLAKQDFDFLYDEKKGGLYFNENGVDKGFGDGGIIAILKGAPDLTSSNFELI